MSMLPFVIYFVGLEMSSVIERHLRHKDGCKDYSVRVEFAAAVVKIGFGWAILWKGITA